MNIKVIRDPPNSFKIWKYFDNAAIDISKINVQLHFNQKTSYIGTQKNKHSKGKYARLRGVPVVTAQWKLNMNDYMRLRVGELPGQDWEQPISLYKDYLMQV